MHPSRLFTIASVAVGIIGTRVSFDPGYDEGQRSLNAVACSNGKHGLETIYGWKVQADIPSFPYIGGAPDITKWNSPSCGTCWKLSYKNNSIFVLGVDLALDGFNVAQAALKDLTHGHARQLGWVDAEASEATLEDCKIVIDD